MRILDQFIDWWDRTFWWRWFAVVLFFFCFAYSVMNDADAAEGDRYGVNFYCGADKPAYGLIANDPEFILGAVLVYIKQITPEDYMKLVAPQNREVVLRWLAACMDITELERDT